MCNLPIFLSERATNWENILREQFAAFSPHWMRDQFFATLFSIIEWGRDISWERTDTFAGFFRKSTAKCKFCTHKNKVQPKILLHLMRRMKVGKTTSFILCTAWGLYPTVTLINAWSFWTDKIFCPTRRTRQLKVLNCRTHSISSKRS